MVQLQAYKELEQHLSGVRNSRIDISIYIKRDGIFHELAIEYHDSPRRGLSIKVCQRQNCATVHGEERSVNSIAEAFALASRLTGGGEPLLQTVYAEQSILPAARKAFAGAFGMALEEYTSKLPIVEFRKSLVKESAEKYLHDGNIEKWNLSDYSEKLWAGINLSKVSLKGMDLSRINLSHMSAEEACFDGSNMTNASLTDSIIDKASFRECKLDSANLSSVSAVKADFSGATMSNIHAYEPNFKNAKMQRVDLSGTTVRRGELRGVNFTDANLESVNFEDCVFDEKTIFPQGFSDPAGLIWKGKGTNPLMDVKALASELQVDTVEDLIRFMIQKIDVDRLDKAIAMLKAKRFQIFSEISDFGVIGIVRSQTDAELVYGCSLDSDGHFFCCTQNLKPCGGLKGKLCKHLMVLIIGLAKAKQFDLSKTALWCLASTAERPKTDKDTATELFLKYGGVATGEVDWRPTETIPEDYYAF